MGNRARMAKTRAEQKRDGMTPEEWRKVKEVLETALELEVAARRNYLRCACAGQPSVRIEVESLLQSHDGDGAFLEFPAAVDAANLELISSSPNLLGVAWDPTSCLNRSARAAWERCTAPRVPMDCTTSKWPSN